MAGLKYPVHWDENDPRNVRYDNFSGADLPLTRDNRSRLTLNVGAQDTGIYNYDSMGARFASEFREDPVIDRESWNRNKFAGGDATSVDGINTKVSRRNNIDVNSQDDEDAVKKYVGLGVGLVSLITENLLSHPLVVLRRQCQVHNNSRRYHLIPVTLVPVIINLQRRQGITTFWKGLGSVLMVRGMTLAVEDLFCKLTPWPKEISVHSSLKSIGQHILLKCTSLAIITPFYSASLVETVQSDIASEKPGIFDVFKEGICRLLSWGAPQKGRMLPIWTLIVPTVMCGLLKYVLSLVIRGITYRIMIANYKNDQLKQGAIHRDVPQTTSANIGLNSALVGFFAGEIIFFPFETILHRMHLQGTRTIIDNLDSGCEVIPILTSYEGARDCYSTIVQQEGVTGLYKGFGALVFQFAAHVAVIKITKFILTEVTNLVRSSSKSSNGDSLEIGNIHRTTLNGNGENVVQSPVGYDCNKL